MIREARVRRAFLLRPARCPAHRAPARAPAALDTSPRGGSDPRFHARLPTHARTDFATRPPLAGFPATTPPTTARWWTNSTRGWRARPRAAARRRATSTPSAASCCARDRITALLDPGSPFLEIAPLAAEGMYDDAAPGAGMVAGIGRVHGPGSRGRRQRRHGQGRHLLPDDGEEAPARAGNRAREPPALRLPGRFRRRVPAAAGRGVPGQGALRPHLLQPGAAERGEHPADRRGDGQLHRRRRLRAGDVRRDRSSSRNRARSSSAARRW